VDFVLIHPLGTSKEAWDLLRPLLEPHGRVIARDLPGFGAEPAYDDGREHSVPNYATTVEGWMDDEGIERAHLIGCSMGGAVSLELARRGRALTTTAISPACGATPGFEARWVANQTKMLRDNARRLRSVAARLYDIKPLRATLYLQYGHPFKLRTEDLVAATGRLADAPGFDDANQSLFTHYGLIGMAAPGLAEIRSPVQILWGSRDLCLFPRQGRRVADAIPGATLTYLPGLGHLSMIDDPELIAKLALNFAREGETTAKGAASGDAVQHR